MDTGALIGVVCVAIIGGYPTIRSAMTLGVVRPVIFGLVAQGLVAIALMIFVGLWAPDAIKYHSMGKELAEHLAGGPEPAIAVGDGKEGFPILLGGLYWLFGPYASIGVAVNWISHGALVVALAATARRLGLPVRWTAWIAALFPPLLLWGGLLLRDSIAWLLIALVILGLAIFSQARGGREQAKGVVLVLSALLALSVVRGSAAMIVCVAAALVLTITARRAVALPHLVLVVAMLGVLLPQVLPIASAYLTGDETREPLPVLESTEEPARDSHSSQGAPQEEDALSQSRGALSRDSTTSFAGPGSSGPPGLVASATRVVAGPLPWEWGRVGPQVVADSAVWLALIIAAAAGTWRKRRCWRSLALLIVPASLLLGALMVTSGNYGTMQRLRLQSEVLLIPIAAAGFQRRDTDEHADSTDHSENRC